MIYNVYSIRDIYTGFLSPVAEVNDHVAQRNFETACMNPDTLLYSNPMDFDLLCVGQFDSDTGELIPCSPRTVCSGTHFSNKEALPNGKK